MKGLFCKLTVLCLAAFLAQGCDTAILAVNAASLALIDTKEQEPFKGIKIPAAQTPKEALLKLRQKKLYDTYPVNMNGTIKLVMLTGVDDNKCLYGAIIPNNNKKTPDYMSIQHYKLCGNNLTALKAVHQNFPVSDGDRDALMRAYVKIWNKINATHHQGELHIQGAMYAKNMATECADSLISVIRGVRLVEYKTTKICLPELKAYFAS